MIISCYYAAANSCASLDRFQCTVIDIDYLRCRVVVDDNGGGVKQPSLRTPADGIPPSGWHPDPMADWWPPPFNQQIPHLHGIHPQICDFELCVYVGAVEQACCRVWFCFEKGGYGCLSSSILFNIKLVGANSLF